MSDYNDALVNINKGAKRDRKAPCRYSQEEQEKLVKSYNSSGLSRDDFCSQNNISRATLYKWMNRNKKKKEASSSSLKFNAVKISEEKSSESSVVVMNCRVFYRV